MKNYKNDNTGHKKSGKMNKISKCMVTLALMFVFGAIAIAQTEILTAEDMAAIGSTPNSMEGSYILMNDIIVDNWVPVGGIDGNDENGFNGVFDGNGHTITINGFDQQLDNTRVGLFGLVGKKGTVKNLRVTGKISYTGGQKFLYIGGIAGFNNGLITCCVSCIDMICNHVDAQTEKKVRHQFGYENGQFGGGVAGINLGVIIHCYSTGSIKVLQGQAAGIAAGNGKPIKGSFGVNVGSDGASVSASPGAVPQERSNIAYCYSLASVSSVVDNTGRKISRILIGGAGGIVATNRIETAAMTNSVSLNLLIEATANNNPKASPFPIFGAAGLAHKNSQFQFYYREDVVTRQYNIQNVEQKSAKISPNCAVAFSNTQEESWWRLPDGLAAKEQRNVLGFPFGEDETAPWKWNDELKRPVLYWEKDTPETSAI
jgi:hypothetical protein